MSYLISQSCSLGLTLPEGDATGLSATIKSSKDLDDLETRLKSHEERLHQMNDSYEALQKRLVELTEYRYVLKYGADHANGGAMPVGEDKLWQGPEPQLNTAMAAEQIGLLGLAGAVAEGSSSVGTSNSQQLVVDIEDARHRPSEDAIGATFGSIYGVISKTKEYLLESVLYRALRGNLYFVAREISEEEILDLPGDDRGGLSGPGRGSEATTMMTTPSKIRKSVFIVSVHGKALLSKVRKLSEALGAHLFTLDGAMASGIGTAELETAARIDELNGVISKTLLTKRQEVEGLRGYLNNWLFAIRKEKLVYHTLNCCSLDANRKCLIAEGWAPRTALDVIQDTLRGMSLSNKASTGAILNEIPISKAEGGHSLVPPTFHPTNKFTHAIQEIVDAYGVGNYREINPALFSLITFPFLFAVMFGDFGHGLLVTVFAAFVCIFEGRIDMWRKKNPDEIVGMIFTARYVILMMGLFSLYMGLIYNDIFSRGIALFPSAFTFAPNGTLINYNAAYTYPFGVDYGWIGAENSLMFLNSYKMKQAVFLGVLQMTFGVILGGLNFYFARNALSFWSIFVPQLVFMLCIFGYLNVMIVYKWITQTAASPSLLTMLINMFLSPGSIDPADRFYEGQEYVQLFLVVIAVLCIPAMFFITPYVKNRQRRLRAAALDGDILPVVVNSPLRRDDISILSGGGNKVVISPEAMHPGDDEDEEDSLMNDMVHSGIHTIEFVLGAISNTASYLRLWALSLAHSQLSDVIWAMIVEYFGASFIIGVLVFPIWLSITVGILIIMEGLSAFLHALRLHWVEFNNKFYQGNGRKFAPFSFLHLDEPTEP